MARIINVPPGFVLSGGRNTSPWQLQYQPTDRHRVQVLNRARVLEAERLRGLLKRKHMSEAKRARVLRRMRRLELPGRGA